MGTLRRLFALSLLGPVLLLTLGMAVARAETVTVPTTPEGEPICVTCHESVSKNVVDTWRSQNHGQNKVGCPTCHNSHDQGFTPKPKAGVCFGCHDVAKAHPDFSPETPGSRCMECHASNVHWLPDESSWFQGGLPTSALDQPTQPESNISASTGRAAGIVVVIVAVVAGLLAGLVFDRFVRDL